MHIEQSVKSQHGASSPAVRSQASTGGSSPCPPLFAHTQVGNGEYTLMPTQLLQPTQVLGWASPNAAAVAVAAASLRPAGAAPEVAFSTGDALVQLSTARNEQGQEGEAVAGTAVQVQLDTEVLPQPHDTAAAAADCRVPSAPWDASAVFSDDALAATEAVVAELPADAHHPAAAAAAAAQEVGCAGCVPPLQLAGIDVVPGGQAPTAIHAHPSSGTIDSMVGQQMASNSTKVVMLPQTEPVQQAGPAPPHTASCGDPQGARMAVASPCGEQQQPPHRSSVNQARAAPGVVVAAACTSTTAGGVVGSGDRPSGANPFVSTAPSSLEWPSYFVREVNHATPTAVPHAAELYRLAGTTEVLASVPQPSPVSAHQPQEAAGGTCMVPGKVSQAMEVDGTAAVQQPAEMGAGAAGVIISGGSAVEGVAERIDTALGLNTAEGQRHQLQWVLHPSSDMIAVAAPSDSRLQPNGTMGGQEIGKAPASSHVGAPPVATAAAGVGDGQQDQTPRPPSQAAPDTAPAAPAALQQPPQQQQQQHLLPAGLAAANAPQPAQQGVTPGTSQHPCSGVRVRHSPIGSSDEGQVVLSVNPELRAELDTYNHGLMLGMPVDALRATVLLEAARVALREEGLASAVAARCKGQRQDEWIHYAELADMRARKALGIMEMGFGDEGDEGGSATVNGHGTNELQDGGSCTLSDVSDGECEFYIKHGGKVAYTCGQAARTPVTGGTASSASPSARPSGFTLLDAQRQRGHGMQTPGPAVLMRSPTAIGGSSPHSGALAQAPMLRLSSILPPAPAQQPFAQRDKMRCNGAPGPDTGAAGAGGGDAAVLHALVNTSSSGRDLAVSDPQTTSDTAAAAPAATHTRSSGLDSCTVPSNTAPTSAPASPQQALQHPAPSEGPQQPQISADMHPPQPVLPPSAGQSTPSAARQAALAGSGSSPATSSKVHPPNGSKRPVGRSVRGSMTSSCEESVPEPSHVPSSEALGLVSPPGQKAGMQRVVPALTNTALPPALPEAAEPEPAMVMPAAAGAVAAPDVAVADVPTAAAIEEQPLVMNTAALAPAPPQEQPQPEALQPAELATVQQSAAPSSPLPASLCVMSLAALPSPSRGRTASSSTQRKQAAAAGGARTSGATVASLQLRPHRLFPGSEGDSEHGTPALMPPPPPKGTSGASAGFSAPGMTLGAGRLTVPGSTPSFEHLPHVPVKPDLHAAAHGPGPLPPSLQQQEDMEQEPHAMEEDETQDPNELPDSRGAVAATAGPPRQKPCSHGQLQNPKAKKVVKKRAATQGFADLATQPLELDLSMGTDEEEEEEEGGGEDQQEGCAGTAFAAPGPVRSSAAQPRGTAPESSALIVASLGDALRPTEVPAGVAVAAPAAVPHLLALVPGADGPGSPHRAPAPRSSGPHGESNSAGAVAAPGSTGRDGGADGSAHITSPPNSIDPHCSFVPATLPSPGRGPPTGMPQAQALTSTSAATSMPPPGPRDLLQGFRPRAPLLQPQHYMHTHTSLAQPSQAGTQGGTQTDPEALPMRVSGYVRLQMHAAEGSELVPPRAAIEGQPARAVGDEQQEQHDGDALHPGNAGWDEDDDGGGALDASGVQPEDAVVAPARKPRSKAAPVPVVRQPRRKSWEARKAELALAQQQAQAHIEAVAAKSAPVAVGAVRTSGGQVSGAGASRLQGPSPIQATGAVAALRPDRTTTPPPAASSGRGSLTPPVTGSAMTLSMATVLRPLAPGQQQPSAGKNLTLPVARTAQQQQQQQQQGEDPYEFPISQDEPEQLGAAGHTCRLAGATVRDHGIVGVTGAAAGRIPTLHAQQGLGGGTARPGAGKAAAGGGRPTPPHQQLQPQPLPKAALASARRRCILDEEDEVECVDMEPGGLAAARHTRAVRRRSLVGLHDSDHEGQAADQRQEPPLAARAHKISGNAPSTRAATARRPEGARELPRRALKVPARFRSQGEGSTGSDEGGAKGHAEERGEQEDCDTPGSSEDAGDCAQRARQGQHAHVALQTAKRAATRRRSGAARAASPAGELDGPSHARKRARKLARGLPGVGRAGEDGSDEGNESGQESEEEQAGGYDTAPEDQVVKTGRRYALRSAEKDREQPPSRLGCSKCRWSVGGCSVCRTALEAARGRSPTTHRPHPPTGDARQAERSPVPARKSGAHHLPAAGTGVAVAAAAAQPLHRVAHSLHTTMAAAAGDACVSSQEPHSGERTKGKRPASSVFTDLASRAKRSRALGIFGGLSFLVTGFRAEHAAARDDVLAAITRNGGRLIEELPAVPAAELHGRTPAAGGQPAAAGGGPSRRRRSSLGPEGGEAGAGAGGNGRMDGFPDVVIAESAERRTCRLLSAVARGAAVLTPQWVHDCLSSGKYLPPESDPAAHIIRPPQPHIRSHGLLAGLRVHLAGTAKFCRDFGAVLVHAGALLMEQLEGQVPVPHAGHGTKGLDGVSVAHVPEPAADLLFMELEALEDVGAKGPAADSRKRKLGSKPSGGTDTGAAALQKRLQQLQRTARRLRVPVYGRDWLVDVVMQGRLPDALQQRRLGAGGPTRAGNVGAGPSGTGVPGARAKTPAAWETTPEAPSSDGEMYDAGVDMDVLPGQARCPAGGSSGLARGPRHCAPAGGAAAVHTADGMPDGGTGSGALRVVRQLQLAGAAPQQPRGNAQVAASKPPRSPLPQRSPAPASAVAAAVAVAGAAVPPAPTGSPSHAHAHSMRPPAPTSPKLTWLGAPVGPPAGIRSAPHRTFYAGFQYGSAAIHAGDCVELAPQAGEPQPRVVQLECVWAERPSDGVPRLLARAKRFYRPEETIFNMALPGGPPLLFSSGHVEERVPLQLVARKVEVAVEGQGASHNNSSSRPHGAAGVGGAGGQERAGSPGGAGSHAPAFVCRFHYDHVHMVLGPPKMV